MSIENELKQMIRATVLEVLSESGSPSEPDLISLEEARLVCGDLGKDAILDLVHNPADTGFPAVILGPRTIKVDRTRLVPWLHGGGLVKRRKQSSNVVEIGDRRSAA